MTNDHNDQLQRNLRNVPVRSGAYISWYPHLAEILNDELGRSKYNRAAGNLFVATPDFRFLDDAQYGLERVANHTLPWTDFKTLRARKSAYAPRDFELMESSRASNRSQPYSFPVLDAIAR